MEEQEDDTANRQSIDERESPQVETPEPKQVTITDQELRSLHGELLEYKDKYLRLLADADNTRKRLQKDREETTRYAISSFAVDVLNPLDNLENALKFAQEMSEEVKNWAFGFQMILNQFKDVLTQNGIDPFESKGNSFDPYLHEAIEALPSDEKEGTILEECVKGYKMGDRVIRPARVKVAKEKDSTTENEE